MPAVLFSHPTFAPNLRLVILSVETSILTVEPRCSVDERELVEQVEKAVVVRREDIVRAKQFIIQDKASNTDGIVKHWFSAVKISSPDLLVFPSSDLSNGIADTAREFSLQIAVYQAVWELIASGEVVAIAPVKDWLPGFSFRIHNMSTSRHIDSLKTYFIPEIYRLPRVESPPRDADVFLEGVGVATLHPGIRSAVEQALGCFRRGLYLPAIAMLGAATEAAWTECGRAVGKKLAVTKLEECMQKPLTGIGKKVSEIRKVLESEKGRTLIKDAGRAINNVLEAEQWTSLLRDKRNALHWGKAGTFIAEHSDTASLLMAAPIHIATLEAVRVAC